MQIYEKILKFRVFLSDIREMSHFFHHPYSIKKLSSMYLEELSKIKEHDKEALVDLVRKSAAQIQNKGDLNIKEIKSLTEKIEKEERAFEEFFRKHPEVWEPGKYDIALTYDYKKVQSQMTQIFNQEEPYLKDLKEKIKELEAKTGRVVNLADIVNTEDVNLKTDLDPKMVDLLNQQYYLNELYFDTIKNIGDKQGQLLWKSIPKAAKKKYINFMNDLMVEILAENLALAIDVKNFYAVNFVDNFREDFIEYLEYVLNENLLGGYKNKVKFKLGMGEDGFSEGSYNPTNGEIKINEYNWYDIDSLITTIKHEFFGHYFNQHFPDMGLYGSIMKDYIERQNDRNYDFGSIYQLIDYSFFSRYHLDFIKSGLTGAEYYIPGITEKELSELQKKGWNLKKCWLSEDYLRYKNSFEEQTAYAITPTKNIQKQVDLHRIKYGFPLISKIKVR